MNPFINRERELESLEAAWRERSPQLLVVYGKRRIGKTSLIKRYVENKPAMYFLADNLPESANLKSLGRTVGEFFGDAFLAETGFSDWYQFFQYLKDNIRRRTVVVLDEFPYLAGANKAVPSVFQKGWDEYLSGLPIVLILCGSSISIMESETLSHKAPLYGRRTGQLFVRPFTFRDTKRFFPRAGTDQCLRLFTVAGGNPAYLKQLDQRLSVRQNVLQRILPPESFLYREVEFILREELREPRNYFNILRAIAGGRTKFGEIVNETGYEKSKLHPYLFALEDLHLIEKEVSVTEKNPTRSRNGRYRLQDQFVKFWFTYVFPYRGEIELDNPAPAVAKLDASFELSVSEQYERIAPEIVRGHARHFFPFMRVGRWWEKGEEIDLVALNEETDDILFGESKWSRRPVGTNVYRDLKRKAGLVQWGTANRKEHFVLLSKSGFTPDMEAVARADGVVLVEGDELLA